MPKASPLTAFVACLFVAAQFSSFVKPQILPSQFNNQPNAQNQPGGFNVQGGANQPPPPQGPQIGNPFLPPPRQNRQRGNNPRCQLSAPGCGLRQPGRPDLTLDDTLSYAKRQDIPWQVSIKVTPPRGNGNSWFCSATLISPDHLLAQAFCLYDKRQGDLAIESTRAILGELNPFNSSALTKSVNLFTVADIRFHPNQDLAVVRLSKPIPRSLANPLCLPDSDKTDHGPGKVSGWPHYILNFLVMGTGVAFPYDHCTGLGNDERSLLCVVNKGPPDCGLDSGSPFFRQVRPGGPFTLVGIKLGDEKCRESDNELSTQRYLRVSQFVNWIAEQVCGLPDDAQEDDDNESGFRH